MKLDPSEVQALARRAEAAGGRSLGISLPGAGVGPIPPSQGNGRQESTAPAEKGPAQPKPSKYRNVQQVYNGVRFDSRAEAKRAADLDELAADLSLWYTRQPRFNLGCPENVYVADFLVVHGGKVHVEDVKGYATPKFLHDVKLWKAHGPCQLWIRSRNGIEYVNGGKCWESIAHGTAGQSSYHKWSEI
jgi:hypothetical protein